MIKFLISKGYSIDRRKGSHCILVKDSNDEELPEIVVPDHKELAKGTLNSIIKGAKISKEEFINYFRKK